MGTQIILSAPNKESNYMLYLKSSCFQEPQRLLKVLWQVRINDMTKGAKL